MTTYGYARVSTRGQDLREQIGELTQSGIDRKYIYSEKFTGTTTKRPKFDSLLSKVTNGDTIVVTKLDRFARNTREALNAIDPLLKNGVTIKVLNLGTIENTPMGRMILRTLLSVAEMERDMIVERTQAGKCYAKKHKPNYREGRPKRSITPKYKEMDEFLKTHTYTETASTFEVSRATVYLVHKQIKDELQSE